MPKWSLGPPGAETGSGLFCGSFKERKENADPFDRLHTAGLSPRELSLTYAMQTIAGSLGNLPLLDDDTVGGAAEPATSLRHVVLSRP